MKKIDTALSEVLIAKGLIARDKFDSLSQEAKGSGTPLLSVIAKRGVVPQDKLSEAIQEKLGLPYLNLKGTSIDRAVIEKVPLKIASYYKFVPVEADNRTLTIAVAEPLDVKTRDDIRTYLGFDIKTVLSCEEDVAERLGQEYGLGAETVEKMSVDITEKEQVWDEPEDKIEDIEKLAGDASVIKLVNQVILEAYRRRATDIHIEPYRGKIKFRYRIDGVLYDVKMPEEIRHFLNPILSRIKIMANMNIVERRLPQDGRAVVKIQDQILDLRVSSIPTPYGESIVIRILPMKLLFSLESLGMAENYLEVFRDFIRKPHGVVFITGPTGSGKTTTLYACLNEINVPERKIVTIEDPIEYEMEGITQIQVSADIGLTFAQGLRSTLRHDPNVVMVGEVRDLETAEIAIRASLTGHLVFSTLHTNDAASGVTRLVDIGVEPYLVASSLESIIAQRLVRMVCPHCREEDNSVTTEIKARIATDLGLEASDDIKAFRGKGCEQCNSTGFYGRTAIYEVLILTEAVRVLIMRKSSSNELKKHAMQTGMMTLRQNGWQKVLAGLTSVEEILNLTPEDKDKVSSGVGPVVLPKPSPEKKPEREIAKEKEPENRPRTEKVEREKVSFAVVERKSGEKVSVPPKKTPSEDTIAMRVYPRVEKKVDVVYKVLMDRHMRPEEEWSPFAKGEIDKEHRTTTKDISAGGASIYADNHIPNETKLDMKIELPDGGAAIQCLARVERSDMIKKDTIYEVAVLFMDMSRADKTRIDKYVKA